MVEENAYICKHIPDHVLKKLDTDYREMIATHLNANVEFELSDMAISDAEIQVNTNLRRGRSMGDCVESTNIMRGVIEAQLTMEFLIIGKGYVEG